MPVLPQVVSVQRLQGFGEVLVKFGPMRYPQGGSDKVKCRITDSVGNRIGMTIVSPLGQPVVTAPVVICHRSPPQLSSAPVCFPLKIQILPWKTTLIGDLGAHGA